MLTKDNIIDKLTLASEFGVKHIVQVALNIVNKTPELFDTVVEVYLKLKKKEIECYYRGPACTYMACLTCTLREEK
jgi:hypothetical protein